MGPHMTAPPACQMDTYDSKYDPIIFSEFYEDSTSEWKVHDGLSHNLGTPYLPMDHADYTQNAPRLLVRTNLKSSH